MRLFHHQLLRGQRNRRILEGSAEEEAVLCAIVLREEKLRGWRRRRDSGVRGRFPAGPDALSEGTVLHDRRI